MLLRNLRTKKKVVAVAMSGGKDSSLAAAILKKKGIKVVGVFMKPQETPNSKNLIEIWNRNFFQKAEQRAKQIASLLGIPFYILNFGKEFKREVINYFSNYNKKRGLFNPCAICNKEIRLEYLLKKTLSWGIDYIGTGHYARLIQETQSSGFHLTSKKNCEYKLFVARNKRKDQSYLLWKLNQKQLKRLLFPLGDLAASEVRFLTKEFKLPALDFSASRETCLLQTISNNFLKKHYKLNLNKIRNFQKQISDQYQIYQGFSFFPLNKKVKRNRWKKEFLVKKINWISGKIPQLPIKVKIRIRYKNTLDTATINYIDDETIKIVFNKPQLVIPSGQVAVFYKKEEVLGGGVIY